MRLSTKPFLTATVAMCLSALAQAQSGCSRTYLEGNRSHDRSIEAFFNSITKSGNETNIFLDWIDNSSMTYGDISALKGRSFQQWNRADWSNLISVLRSLPTQSSYLKSHLQQTTPDLRQEVLLNLENKISIVRCYSEASAAAQSGNVVPEKDSGRSTAEDYTKGRLKDGKSSESRAGSTKSKEALDACGRNADYVGVRGNQRSSYIRNCLNDRGDDSSDENLQSTSDMPTPAEGKNRNSAAFVYDSHKNQCISVIQSPSGGPYQGIRNSCEFNVDVIFCIENGVDSKGECSKRQFKRIVLPAGNYEVIDAYNGGMTAKVFAIACREPYYVAPSKTVFRGNKIAGDCQAEKKR